ncbi:ferredoxin-NADP reductase [Methylobacterium sp. PvP062]|uniref:Ferredoxin-NADP reductase n=1 Tax=Methylobacterium radiotolerans TaxID=31998 RepID=A0ABV2NTR5_9HYPH|nr:MULTISPECIES: PDR/VanB family oxidoreductase [unclassified Methylobacterium]MBP2498292.1 ferredoxin-NADP reductase [Methylobacterium sp. PvP105]MBP2505676.1 ferredoxin-NADP reductase [Methylobacterium sp. PvP109]
MKTIVTEHRDELQVVAKTPASETVVAVTLSRPDGQELPGWTAGAHIDLELPNGLTRQYSLCGDPNDRRIYRVAVLREEAGRGGSQFIHEELAVGQRINVKGPRNNFGWVRSDRQLFIAGGIGITPIVPMIAAAERSGVDWRLLYVGRRLGSMAFLADLSRYGDRVNVVPKDKRGRIDLAAQLEGLDRETLIYCCGPEALVAAVEALAGRRPEGTLHVERFKPKAASTEAGAFVVELRRSGVTLEVPPDKSILATIQEAGLIVPCSCEEGTCGTCETGVLEGEPDHRDSVLSAAEQATNRVLMICVSRAKSERLVLDL